MEPQIILLLGSFDKETKEVLNEVKNDLVKFFSAQDLYCFLLDDLDVFVSSDNEYGMLVERYNQDSITVFLFDRERRLLDSEDMELKSDAVTLKVYEFLKKWCDKMNKSWPEKIISHTIFMKLDLLFRTAKIILIIRHQEKTRGGEYIEMAYGIGKYHDKFYFFAKNDIPLSVMVDEILREFKVQIRNYTEKKHLISQVIDIIKHNVV